MNSVESVGFEHLTHLERRQFFKLDGEKYSAVLENYAEKKHAEVRRTVAGVVA